MEPLSPILNCAAQTFATRLFPLGFDIVDCQPYDDAAELIKSVRARGRIYVSSTHCGTSVFASPDINICSRAWHDWVHFRYGLEFDLAGETLAAFVQLAQFTREYGTEYDAGAVLLIEIIGQSLYHEKHGRFPDDQMAFTVAQLESGLWLSLARQFMDEIEERELTDSQALAMARREGSGLWRYALADTREAA